MGGLNSEQRAGRLRYADDGGVAELPSRGAECAAAADDLGATAGMLMEMMPDPGRGAVAVLTTSRL